MTNTIELEAVQAAEDARTRAGASWQDGLFLSAAILLSLVLYVSRLGFYSDDWVFLSLMNLSPDQSLTGLVRALVSGDLVIRQRPVQIIYLVALHRLFGLQPLGYHLANAAVLLANGLLLHQVVRALGLHRRYALAIPLVYALLPHYSTDRFWVAAFQATLSVTFYLAGLYAAILALRGPTARLAHRSRRSIWWRGLIWRVVSFGALLLSGLAYEVTLPLFLLNPVFAWYAARGEPGAPELERVRTRRALALFLETLLALVLLAGYKALVTVRLNAPPDLVAHVISVAAGAVRVNFGAYGLGLPYVVGWILWRQPPWWLLVTAGSLGVLSFRHLYRVSDGAAQDRDAQKTDLGLIGVGLVVFVLGYAIFVANADLWFTSASLGNRVAIAASIGVTLVLVGAASRLSRLFTAPAARSACFSLAVALLAASGLLINNTLANFWHSAYQQQEQVMAGIQQHLPDLPSHSTLVLDGICLERGGAYIFTGQRDLASRLRMAYDDPTLNASAITNRPRIEAEGLSILTYRAPDFFPYGENLLMYHYGRKQAYPLTDEAAAWRYFETVGSDPERDCPPGFAWQWEIP